MDLNFARPLHCQTGVFACVFMADCRVSNRAATLQSPVILTTRRQKVSIRILCETGEGIMANEEIKGLSSGRQSGHCRITVLWSVG